MIFAKRPSDLLLHGHLPPRARFHQQPPGIEELRVFSRSTELGERIPLTLETIRAVVDRISKKPSDLATLVDRIMTMKKNSDRGIFVEALISSNIRTGDATDSILPTVKKIADGEHLWKIKYAVMLLTRFTRTEQEIFSWIGNGNKETKIAALSGLAERIKNKDCQIDNLESRLLLAKKRNPEVASEIQAVIELLNA